MRNVGLNRRCFLTGTLGAGGFVYASALFPGAALGLGASGPRRRRMRSLDALPERQVVVWRPEGRFTKNPDLIRFPSGKMMLVYNDCDAHWPQETTRITTLESLDGGKTWGNPRVVSEADKRKGQERWVTPRLSRLRDGRLAIICDQNDFSHVHEDQPPGIWIWFSSDEGRSWSEPVLTGVPGFEPDRIVELGDGTLLMASQVYFKATRKLGAFVMRSTDGGTTWKDRSIIAADVVHHHTEGAIVVLSDGTLGCVLRESNHHGYPSYLSLSSDGGRSWSRPEPLPFAGDRPYAKQLPGGQVLVTYRNRSGNRGTHAWIGDLRRNPGFKPGGVHYHDKVTLESGELSIEGVPDGETRYILLPPENFRSDLLLEATLRVAGPPNQPIASLEIGRLERRLDICSNGLWLYAPKRDLAQNRASGGRIDLIHRVDMRKSRNVRLRAQKGLFTVEVDGKVVLSRALYNDFPLQETWFGRAAKGLGKSWWRALAYQVSNETEPDHRWEWQAQRGEHPDQYQLDHMLELHANPPSAEHRPDNGYSSWVQLEDGRIFMVDYSNRGDPPPGSHLYGVYFSPEDFEI